MPRSLSAAGSAHGRALQATSAVLAFFVMPTLAGMPQTPPSTPTAESVEARASEEPRPPDDVPVIDPSRRTPLAPLASATGIVIRENRTYYDVDATRIADMRRQLDARGPRNAFGHPSTGLTRSTLTARYTLWSSPGRCTIGEVVVETEIDLHLPRWQPAGMPQPTLLQRWEWLSTTLVEHEEGHRENAVRAAAELRRRLQALPAAPDCRTLERTARRVREAVVSELRARDTEYDARTDYGRAALAERIEADDRKRRKDAAESETERARRLIQGF
jgi:predicted secreted Zn-dependent protease